MLIPASVAFALIFGFAATFVSALLTSLAVGFLSTILLVNFFGWDKDTAFRRFFVVGALVPIAIVAIMTDSLFGSGLTLASAFLSAALTVAYVTTTVVPGLAVLGIIALGIHSYRNRTRK